MVKQINYHLVCKTVNQHQHWNCFVEKWRTERPWLAFIYGELFRCEATALLIHPLSNLFCTQSPGRGLLGPISSTPRAKAGNTPWIGRQSIAFTIHLMKFKVTTLFAVIAQPFWSAFQLFWCMMDMDIQTENCVILITNGLPVVRDAL